MIIDVITPMWPTPTAPHKGIFVQRMNQGFEQEGLRIGNIAKVEGQPKNRRHKILGHAKLLASLLEQASRAPDILYCHAPSWFAPLVEIAAERARRLVVHAHGGEVYPFSKAETYAQPLVGRLARKADLVVSPSAAYAEKMQATFQISLERSFVSPSGGIDASLFQPRSPKPARTRWGLNGKRPVVGFVGRLDRVKGPLTLAEAVKPLDVDVVIVGTGEVYDELRRALPRARYVDFVPQADLPEVYAAFDVLAFPTEREALGLVPIEALACGVPVVAPRAFANGEFVRDDESGVLVAPGSAEALRAGIQKALTRPRTDWTDGCRRVALEYEQDAVAHALVRRLQAL